MAIYRFSYGFFIFNGVFFFLTQTRITWTQTYPKSLLKKKPILSLKLSWKLNLRPIIFWHAHVHVEEKEEKEGKEERKKIMKKMLIHIGRV